MAKFAQIGYGSDGRAVGKSGTGYTYVVNDNVRVGDDLQPVVSHYLSKKAFVTTGQAISTSKNLSTERNLKQQLINQEAKTQLKNKGYLKLDAEGKIVDVESVREGETGIKKIYTGKELGVTGSRVPKQAGELSQYTQQTRAGNLAMQKQKDPNTVFTEKSQQTFDEYSKQFMPKGE